jgi:hypothetical protein
MKLAPIALAAALVAVAGGFALSAPAARESITVALGDTIQPRFFIRTDTVLKVVGNRIVASKCSNSFIYLRTYKGTAQLSADTISVTVTCPQQPPPALSGPVAAYDFNEASGSGVIDLSGGAFNGTFGAGVARVATGKFGGALSFSGGTVTVPNAPALQLTTAMTLEAWVNPTSVGSDWRDVIHKARDNYYLMASGNGTAPVGGGTFGLDDTTTQAFGVVALPVGIWSHIATTYDGTAIRLYVNGALVASKPRTGPLRVSASSLTIGGDSVFGQRFQGMIDEVRVYSRALSTSEIAADMNTPVTVSQVASLEVCLIPVDSAIKYGIDGSRSISAAQAVLQAPWCRKSDTLRLESVPSGSSTLERIVDVLRRVAIR